MNTTKRALGLALLWGGLSLVGGCEKPLEKGPPQKKKNRKSVVMAPVKAPPSSLRGKPFTQQKLTTLSALVSNAKSLEGKTVRIQGVLVAHCYHRHGWFAVAPSKDSKLKVQIQTAPAFLVPADVKVGVTRAEAEGVVELRTIPEARAKHLARDHGLFGGDAASLKGPQVFPRLRATGASFQ